MVKTKETNIFLSIFLIIMFLLILNFYLSSINNIAMTDTINNLRAEEDERNIKTYTIKPGDSLWNIVKQKTESSQDIRRIVYEIRDYNELSDLNLSPGETIKIPQDLL